MHSEARPVVRVAANVLLSFDLKHESVLHWRGSCRNRFQTRGPATEKRRRPSEVSARETVNKFMFDDI